MQLLLQLLLTFSLQDERHQNQLPEPNLETCDKTPDPKRVCIPAGTYLDTCSGCALAEGGKALVCRCAVFSLSLSL